MVGDPRRSKGEAGNSEGDAVPSEGEALSAKRAKTRDEGSGCRSPGLNTFLNYTNIAFCTIFNATIGSFIIHFLHLDLWWLALLLIVANYHMIRFKGIELPMVHLMSFGCLTLDGWVDPVYYLLFPSSGPLLHQVTHFV